MAYLKNWTDNFFQMFFMGTSGVAVSINNIRTRASREMASRKNIQILYFNGVNVAKHWYLAGRGICHLISDCLVWYLIYRLLEDILIRNLYRILIGLCILNSLKNIDLHRSMVKVTGTVHCFLKVHLYIQITKTES